MSAGMVHNAELNEYFLQRNKMIFEKIIINFGDTHTHILRVLEWHAKQNWMNTFYKKKLIIEKIMIKLDDVTEEKT